MTTKVHRLPAALLLGACALAVAGCSGGPTYGTGESQSQQLFNDIDGIFSLGNTNRERIDYTPRPELVRPAAIGSLPPPRSGTVAANDPRWPQSPEVIRARNLAAAEATRGEGLLPPDYNPRQRDPNAPAPTGPSAIQEREISESWLSPTELRRHRREVQQAEVEARPSPTRRRYLSEPPLAYRQPATTAPVGDVGVDEEVKARRADGVRPIGSRIRDALPF